MDRLKVTAKHVARQGPAWRHEAGRIMKGLGQLGLGVGQGARG